MGTALEKSTTALNRLTGEAILVHGASTETLAEYLADLQLIRQALRDEEENVQRELLRRLDSFGRWTEHLEDARYGYKLTAPSPTAGTTDYDRHILLAGLVDLVGRKVVAPEAARAAIVRSLTGTFSVDVETDLGPLVAQLEKVTALLKIPVYDVKVSTSEKVTAAGVKRLERMGGEAAQLVELAKRAVPQGQRKVKVEARVKRA
jgi:hypothetical protein